MTDEERYDNALRFAAEKHKGQFRIGGAEYITHPMAVAEIVREKGKNIDCQIAALFHDLLEDTDATENEILALSNENVLEAVKLLTKQKGYVMESYVSAIRKNEMAFSEAAEEHYDRMMAALPCRRERRVFRQ